MPRTYDTETARQEFDYLTGGWDGCGKKGLMRILPLVRMISPYLPMSDPRHEIIRQIGERIKKG